MFSRVSWDLGMKMVGLEGRKAPHPRGRPPWNRSFATFEDAECDNSGKVSRKREGHTRRGTSGPTQGWCSFREHFLTGNDAEGKEGEGGEGMPCQQSPWQCMEAITEGHPLSGG